MIMALIHIAALLTVVTLSSSSVFKSPANKNGTFELLILHNNDMHARFEQTSQMSGTCTTADRDAGKCYGGFPRVAHVVKEARRAAASGEGPPVLYLNAGDTYTGTAWFTLYKWKIAAEFVNALQPDAVSLGNNELKLGSNELSPFLYDLKTTILATNIVLKSEESQKLQKSVIFNINGIKVALVGYLTPETSVLDSSGNIEYIDEVIALKDEVSRLQVQNINIIIALGHSTVDKDMEIATEVEGIDLVIGGHRNVFYWNGTNAEQQYDEPIVVTQKSGKKVPVIQSYAYNKYLGKLYANFNKDGDMTTYEVDSILLDEYVAQDRDAVEVIKNHISELVSKTGEIVGDTAVALDGDSCKVEECNLGNLITDAITYYYALRYEGETWTDAALAVIPSGFIAASISPENRPSAVTVGDLIASLPIESNLAVVTMNGDVLLQILEHAVSTYSVSNPTGQLLQMSGIRVVYDLAREPGSRVVSAVVRCWSCYVPEFYTIDDWRSYKILMPTSMATGELGYTMLNNMPREELVYDEVTCAAEYIEMRSPVYPEVAGRIVLLNVEDDESNGAEEPNLPDSAIALSSTLFATVCVALIPLFNF